MKSERTKHIDSEADAVFKEELEKQKKRLAKTQTTCMVLFHFLGRGMADEMPLGEALGFLDERLKTMDFASPPPSGDIRYSDIRTARDFLAALIEDPDAELHESTHVGSALNALEKEKEKLALLNE